MTSTRNAPNSFEEQLQKQLEARVSNSVPHAAAIHRFITGIAHLAYQKQEVLTLLSGFTLSKKVRDLLETNQGKDWLVIRFENKRVLLNIDGTYVDITEHLTEPELGVLAREIIRTRRHEPMADNKIRCRNPERHPDDEKERNDFVSVWGPHQHASIH